MENEFDFGTDDNIDWEAYVAECMKTEPVSQGKVADKSLTVADHGIIGMMTEAGELLDQMKKHWFYGRELDVVNIKEELGDILWYAAIFSHERGLGPYAVDSLVSPLRLRAEDVISNAMFYRLFGSTASLYEALIRDGYLVCIFKGIIKNVMKIAFLYDLSTIDILETNIRKLRKRFPSSFEQDKAINRDLDAEREILEGNNG